MPPLDAGDGARRFAAGPRYGATFECLPTCQGADNPPRYAPVSVHDYRTGRFAAGAGGNKPFGRH
ncbi:MAG: hypothetical protein GKR94_30215 [Gammaproteobacteria bacterium]|nr:hypothetical protein [Gammaproteobacteria bacterium]